MAACHIEGGGDTPYFSDHMEYDVERHVERGPESYVWRVADPCK